tara:strand:- start:12 stop:413 length:402 start_codon:yes stop_codon:yes gene_type:complete
MKNVEKLSLNELALQLTKSNIQKTRSSKKSINDYLVEILGDGKKSYTRIELTNLITVERLKDSGITDDQLHNGLLKKDVEIIEKFTKMNKTVKNGLDTSISKGKSSSCFVSSKYSDQYELIQDEDRKYKMVLK